VRAEEGQGGALLLAQVDAAAAALRDQQIPDQLQLALLMQRVENRPVNMEMFKKDKCIVTIIQSAGGSPVCAHTHTQGPTRLYLKMNPGGVSSHNNVQGSSGPMGGQDFKASFP